MPNQSGKVILVLVLLLLILGAVAYFFLPVFKKQESIEQVEDPSFASVEVVEKEDSISRCKTDFDDDTDNDEGVWEYLPNEVKDETYKKDRVSAGEATYQIYLLKRSNDCKYLAFMIELEARGGGAYDDEDYKNRGVYIFDSEEKKIITAMMMPKDLFFDKDEYGSNLWISDNKYQFVLSESTKQGDFVKTRYTYDLKNNKLSKSTKEL